MKKKIKVVHIMPQIGIGGAETQLYALIINSDPQVVTHEVLYYSDSHDDEGFKLYTEAGIKYTRIPRNKKKPIRFLRDLTASVKARKPDIVHCWLYSGNVWGRWAAILAGVKSVIVAYRACCFVKIPILKLQECITPRRVHHLANSYACAKFVAETIGVAPEKFNVIYNGLEVKKFNVPDRRSELFALFNIPADAKIVTMVGRLMPPKNYPMFIEAARMAGEHKLPLHFIIVGTGSLRDELEAMVRKLNIEKFVHFTGIRTDIPEILASSDIFLFTTKSEGFPNAILEAMAAELPVITTNFGSVGELIEDGVNGTIIPINDASAAVAALKSYLDNPSKARLLAAAARASVEQRFSMQAMVNNTLQFYHNIISENNEPPNTKKASH
jgi:glycosyltransferase involved in cell wall biosynthesis